MPDSLGAAWGDRGLRACRARCRDSLGTTSGLLSTVVPSPAPSSDSLEPVIVSSQSARSAATATRLLRPVIRALVREALGRVELSGGTGGISPRGRTRLLAAAVKLTAILRLSVNSNQTLSTVQRPTSVCRSRDVASAPNGHTFPSPHLGRISRRRTTSSSTRKPSQHERGRVRFAHDRR